MAKYGYTGAKPTQAKGSNSGVFGVNDVVQLINQDKFGPKSYAIEYLVISGGAHEPRPVSPKE